MQRRIAVYDWKTWDGFLLPIIFPDSTRIEARSGESTESVLQKVVTPPSHFAFHVCLSYSHTFPIDREVLCHRLSEAGVKLLNECVTDVTKRHIQDVLISASLPSLRVVLQGDPEERLIVKSNYNYGGEAEERLGEYQMQALGLPPRSSLIKNSRDYRVLQRSDVESWMWNCESLAIERFVENADHVFYRSYVCGSSVAVSRVYDSALIKKMPIGIPRETVFLSRDSVMLRHEAGPSDFPSNLLDSLGVFCSAFRLDFGAIDIVQDSNGCCYIIDVNNTPHWGNGGHPDLLAFLAEGV